jgi:hypothetical protein
VKQKKSPSITFPSISRTSRLVVIKWPPFFSFLSCLYLLICLFLVFDLNLFPDFRSSRGRNATILIFFLRLVKISQKTPKYFITSTRNAVPHVKHIATNTYLTRCDNTTLTSILRTLNNLNRRSSFTTKSFLESIKNTKWSKTR